MHLELIAFKCSVVPDVHDEKEGASNHEGDPTALIYFKQHGREICALDDKGQDRKQEDEAPVAVPDEQHY